MLEADNLLNCLLLSNLGVVHGAISTFLLLELLLKLVLLLLKLLFNPDFLLLALDIHSLVEGIELGIVSLAPLSLRFLLHLADEDGLFLLLLCLLFSHLLHVLYV